MYGLNFYIFVYALLFVLAIPAMLLSAIMAPPKIKRIKKPKTPSLKQIAKKISKADRDTILNFFETFGQNHIQIQEKSKKIYLGIIKEFVESPYIDPQEKMDFVDKLLQNNKNIKELESLFKK